MTEHWNWLFYPGSLILVDLVCRKYQWVYSKEKPSIEVKPGLNKAAVVENVQLNEPHIDKPNKMTCVPSEDSDQPDQTDLSLLCLH